MAYSYAKSHPYYAAGAAGIAGAGALGYRHRDAIRGFATDYGGKARNFASDYGGKAMDYGGKVMDGGRGIMSTVKGYTWTPLKKGLSKVRNRIHTVTGFQRRRKRSRRRSRSKRRRRSRKSRY